MYRLRDMLIHQHDAFETIAGVMISTQVLIFIAGKDAEYRKRMASDIGTLILIK